jgi:methylmalonyl-CoA mutase N-terminal domain/subunit
LTPEGISVAPVYRASDIAGLDCLDSFPGITSYVRGPYPAMYVERPWSSVLALLTSKTHECDNALCWLLARSR